MDENKVMAAHDAEYEAAKKTLVLMCLNQYSDFLASEIKAKEAEAKAYESMQIFGNSFTPDDLKKMMENLNVIANSPQLPRDCYEKICQD